MKHTTGHFLSVARKMETKRCGRTILFYTSIYAAVFMYRSALWIMDRSNAHFTIYNTGFLPRRAGSECQGLGKERGGGRFRKWLYCGAPKRNPWHTTGHFVFRTRSDLPGLRNLEGLTEMSSSMNPWFFYDHFGFYGRGNEVFLLQYLSPLPFVFAAHVIPTPPCGGGI